MLVQQPTDDGFKFDSVFLGNTTMVNWPISFRICLSEFNYSLTQKMISSQVVESRVTSESRLIQNWGN